MERTRNASNQPNRLERTLAHLKIVSRLLGHELHAQNAPRLTFSRDEVLEIQTSIDLFIEEVLRSVRGASGGPTREVEIPTVEARVN
jgi:ribosome-binding factor A